MHLLLGKRNLRLISFSNGLRWAQRIGTHTIGNGIKEIATYSSSNLTSTK